MADFIAQQKLFTDHIRDPNNPAPDNIEARRMLIYQELFFNNIDGFVSSAFPVLKSLYKPDQWKKIVRQFFIVHHCHSPLFLEISAEFIDFLINEYQQTEHDYPFMIELAHYEWVELVISSKQETALYKFLPDNFTSEPAYRLQGLVLSELAWPLQYQYPVNQISIDYIPQPEPCHIVVYRDLQLNVEFMAVSPATLQLLAIINEHPDIGIDLLINKVQKILPDLDDELLVNATKQALIDLSARGIVRSTFA